MPFFCARWRSWEPRPRRVEHKRARRRTSGEKLEPSKLCTASFLASLHSGRDEMARLDKALELLDELHAQDPSHPHSLEYHRSLAHYTRHLSPSASPPSEALTLAANAQHVHRWKRPRTEYPDGLAGYKMWRVSLTCCRPPARSLARLAAPRVYTHTPSLDARPL